MGSTVAARIRRGDFDRIVLVNRYEVADPTFDGWYANQLGPTVMTDIQDRYSWIGAIEGFQIYAPNPPSG